MTEELSIMLATYNEVGNVENMVREIRKYHPEANIVFVDDNSPDGTADLVKKLAESDDRLFLILRPGKQGIGSAHQDGLAWAYDRGVKLYVTMDCDFAHSPSDIQSLIDNSEDVDVVVGNRFRDPDSLSEWNWYRRFLTHAGHLLTRTCLGFDHDATGAFRLYRLDRIDRGIFSLVTSPSYAFFFESILIFVQNGLRITDVSIRLPGRTYGESKLRLTDIFNSVKMILGLALKIRLQPKRHILSKDVPACD